MNLTHVDLTVAVAATMAFLHASVFQNSKEIPLTRFALFPKIHAIHLRVVRILSALYSQTDTLSAHVCLVTLNHRILFEVVLSQRTLAIPALVVLVRFVTPLELLCVRVKNHLLVIHSVYANHQLLMYRSAVLVHAVGTHFVMFLAAVSSAYAK